MNLPTRVKIIDVGPRDGLQNEKQPVPAAVKNNHTSTSTRMPTPRLMRAPRL